VDFWLIYNIRSPKQTQRPPENCKAPLLKTFWRRFWI